MILVTSNTHAKIVLFAIDPKRYSVDEALDIIFADNDIEGEGADVTADDDDDRDAVSEEGPNDHETEAVAETDDSSTSLNFPLGQENDDASLPQDDNAGENSNRVIDLLNFSPVESRGPRTRGGRRGPRTRGGTRGEESRKAKERS